jgi:phosphoribosylanthranilate isomerase
MSGPTIKICGITTHQALDAAIRAHADYVGLNFFPPSPRFISLKGAADLAARAEGHIVRVGLFVDASDTAIAEAVAASSLDVLQLHGTETPQRAAQLGAQFGLPVWKALTVATSADVDRAQDFAGAADLILFDAKTPKGAALPGGMGLSFDWNLVAHWKGPIAWGLAGGLTADNVVKAVGLTGALSTPEEVSSSGAPGIKDVDKIAAFCKAARRT